MEDTLNAIRHKPRFKLYTGLTPKEFTENLQLSLVQNTGYFSGKINIEESIIQTVTKKQPLWKPQLALRAETEEGTGTVIRGIFGPNPVIWVFFMFLYIATGTSLVVLGSVYVSLFLAKATHDSEYNWVGIVCIACALLLMLTYILSRIGKAKAKNEMQELRKFAEAIVLKYQKTN